MRPFNILSFKKNCIISPHSKVYPFSFISNSIIDDFTYISYNCKINNTTVGKFCSIAQSVKMGLGKHPIDYLSSSPIFYAPKNPLLLKISDSQKFDEFAPIIVGNDVWIGINVTILDGITIGDGAIIGAYSLVTKDIAPYSIVGGVPAKEIKKRFEPEIIEKLLKLKWWDYPIALLKKESILELFSKVLDKSALLELEIRLKKQ